ncbi:MAG TPA: thiamine pyrophosphate-binding protein [Candidatus Binataceae bacterium]|nr:thiamine pyrophosphate-binding protein [Candidatus Binataceae bacterium]HVB81727.1 thiamine pyrophosphate-binding protein [Candidatus Binataceae bacterium]
MSELAKTRTGGQVLIDQLMIHGVDTAFCVPGESYLAALDAMYDVRERLRLIVCRQEGGAAYMAEAYGKLTGRPGVCFVTRGPGATNASIGLHTAYQDSTPLVIFIGQVPRAFAEREAFQEIDFRHMYGPFTKWVAQIDDASRIPEFVAHAFTLACSGRPGPVALVLPEDMLCDRVATADAAPYQAVQASPGADQMARLRELLAAARHPMMLLGGSTWTPQAVRDIGDFAAANRLATATSIRCQDHFDNLHPCYAGDLGIAPNPKLLAMFENADLVLAVGPRLGEATTGGYELFKVPRPRQKLVHVHAGSEELGRVYQAALPIVAGMPQFAAAAKAMKPVDASAWEEQIARAHQDYLAYGEPLKNPGEVQLAEIVASLRDQMPPDTIVTNGGGNFTGWVHRFWRFRELGTQLAPTNGSMGYGVPSGVAAALVYPDRRVLSFSGDGCFLMNGQEIATAHQYRVAPIFLVINNRMYGTIRMHQEREYPTRVIASDLVNPDFAALARAYGLHGETVKRTGEFADAFERSLRSGRAALIEIQLDPEALTTRATLSGLRESSLRAGR